MARKWIIEAREGSQNVTPFEQEFSQTGNLEPSSADLFSTQQAAALATGGIALVRQFASDEISRIGIRTGNVEQQNRINNGLKVAGYFGTLAQGTAGGFAVGGAFGAGAGFIGAGIYITYDVIRETSDYYLNQNENNIKVEYNRRQSILTNRNKRGVR